MVDPSPRWSSLFLSDLDHKNSLLNIPYHFLEFGNFFYTTKIYSFQTRVKIGQIYVVCVSHCYKNILRKPSHVSGVVGRFMAHKISTLGNWETCVTIRNARAYTSPQFRPPIQKKRGVLWITVSISHPPLQHKISHKFEKKKMMIFLHCY